MRLTRYTDYAMRVLLQLAARDDGLASIGEIARLYDISQNHLMKVVQDLGKAGFVRTVRGRGGGIALAMPADRIVVGQVVRHTEDGFHLVDCTACDALAMSRLAETIVWAVFCKWWNRSDWFATRLATSWTLPAMSASSTPSPPMRSASWSMSRSASVWLDWVSRTANCTEDMLELSPDRADDRPTAASAFQLQSLERDSRLASCLRAN